jgi:hypothetical protein
MSVRLMLQFYPNQANPARASGRGVYRVYSCGYVLPRLTAPLVHVQHYPGRRSLLEVLAARGYKVGSRVDPVRVALEYQRTITPLDRAA